MASLLVPTWPEPPDEAERMETLRNTDLLDSPVDEEFERITALCASALRVPICLVSLVDEKRQWFLSNRGLGKVKETGRELAFCAHAIMPKPGARPRPSGELERADVMVVRDALQDERFRETGLVTGWPHIRFYAGTPLLIMGPNGRRRPIGTLCVIDTAIEHGGTGARCEGGFGVREKQILMDFGALLTGAIEARRQAKISLSMAKSDYISCTAHDIRTPVACFQLSLELLAQSQLNEEQREYVKHAQQSVEVMTETVDRAIETARAQRGGAPATARREAVNVRQLLGKVDTLTRSLSAQRPDLRLTVDEDVPAEVCTDGTLLWRCLMNYVTNALKAAGRVPPPPGGRACVDVRVSKVAVDDTGVTPEASCSSLVCRAGAIIARRKEGSSASGSETELSVGPLPPADDDGDVVGLAPAEAPSTGAWLKLEVEDRGPGVDPAIRRRLFEAFAQAPGAREGTGLGLFAVRQCCEILGGACGAVFKRPARASPRGAKRARTLAIAPSLAATTSPEDQTRSVGAAGSVFWVLIPFRLPEDPNSSEVGSPSSLGVSPAARSRGLAPARQPSGDRRTALVVEDSLPIRRMLKRILERCDFAVDEASNGEAGLLALKARPYDICIMDFLMPIMDGIQCTRAYRAWERAQPGRKTVIIGSSANAEDADVSAARACGLDDFLPKPVATSTLRKALAKYSLLPEDAAPVPEPAPASDMVV
mmetsp:Transcript_9983/g.29866  ORF Transcript_9983/g.29866 Transcript_9983/m.29866 type:complete len:711 (-) Transcript_9983:22-2154(-)